MYRLNFDWEFYYSPLPFPPYRDHPIVIPVLKDTSKSTREIDVPAIVDTGSELTIFQGQYANSIGITINKGKRDIISTFGGYYDVYVHSVILIIRGYEFQTDVCFPDQKIPRNILGRSFLNLVKLGLDEKYQTFYMSPN